MKILIATGIYPPRVGGPSQYAKNVKAEWEKGGHKVRVKTFTLEHFLPSGIRHLYYFIKIIPGALWCDFIFALDTFSVGWPATSVAKLFGKKIILRTGGDFLWEGYVERTRDLVLLRDFYKTTRGKWSRKERLIFKLTKWTLRNVNTLIFSTKWQRDIWLDPYELSEVRTALVENYYGAKEESFQPAKKDFIGGTRPLVWKNLELVHKVFASKEVEDIGATFRTETYDHAEFMKKISHSYAVILASLGDISPNLILDAIRHNKPFIITRENGLMDRIGDIAIVVDPKNSNDIKEKILWLCEKDNYENQVEKIKNFNFTHTWEEVAYEIIELWKKL